MSAVRDAMTTERHERQAIALLLVVIFASLAYRFAASAYLARSLEQAGLPVVKPAAAHAVSSRRAAPGMGAAQAAGTWVPVAGLCAGRDAVAGS